MATSLKLNDEIRQKVYSLAQSKHRTSHWIMCEAIKQYVQTEELKEKFKQEALESWQDYQETGLHLTGDEVEAWLSTWGTDKEDGMPACHE